MMLVALACGVAGYLIGSIPFGWLIVRILKGVDIRQYGSGRTGGTNVFRVAGFPAAFATAVLDLGKGAALVLVLRQWLPHLGGWPEVCGGIGVVLGHNASVFLKFHGGAGGATSVGTALALWPLGGLPALIIGLFFLFVVGYASLATILACLSVAAVFTAGAFAAAVPPAYAVFGWAVMALTVIALRPNIARLLAGTEKRVTLQDKRIV